MSSQQKFNKLAGKHVLIVGGTSGIEYGVAEGSIDSGARVTVSSSSQVRVKSTIESLKKAYPSSQVDGYTCDLAATNVEENIKQLFERTGKVDHIIFTAGDKLAITSLSEMTAASIEKAGRIRFVAQLLVATIGSKYINPGPTSSIVLTAGSIAEHPQPGWTVVAGYAAGMHGATRNLALDLKPIRVNLVSPGLVATEMWNVMPEDRKSAFFKKTAESVPTGHVATTDELAEVYLWLMKDSNATGVVARSDSGASLV